MDSELTPRQKAEGVMTQWKSGLGVGEPGLVDAITTAIQQQSNEDLARHREKRAALEAQLAAANERITELAVSMISLKSDLRKFAVEECSWAVVEYLDSLDHGECAAILAAVREKARREGAVEELKQFRNWMWELAVPDEVNTMAEADRRIAALEAKQ